MANPTGPSQETLDKWRQTFMDQWKKDMFRPAVETKEEYVCHKYFGGMPIEKAVEILRKHAPEYFI